MNFPKIITLLSFFSVLIMGCGQQEPSAPVAVSDPAPSPAQLLALPELIPLVTTSQVVLTVVKDGNVPVKATLNLAAGKFSLADGSAELDLDLASFNSGLPLRNDRVTKVFFGVKEGQPLNAQLSLDPLSADTLAKLKKNHRLDQVTVTGELGIGLSKQKISAQTSATVSPKGRLVVSSLKPVELTIAGFGLSENLKKLIQLCAHQSVDDQVKVDFSIEFMAPAH